MCGMSTYLSFDLGAGVFQVALLVGTDSVARLVAAVVEKKPWTHNYDLITIRLCNYYATIS